MSELEPFFKNRCKAMQKEIDRLKEDHAKRERLWLDHQKDFLDKNKKMRECLNFVVDNLYPDKDNAEVILKCLNVLKEME